MGNSQFHDMLLTYYGEERLRYIYLVRDCRDVALSFMRTPVGDCHYYAIITKWTNLQRHALHVLSVSEDLVHQASGFSHVLCIIVSLTCTYWPPCLLNDLMPQVRYESLLKDNAATMKELNDFMGKRKFGKVSSQNVALLLMLIELILTVVYQLRCWGADRLLYWSKVSTYNYVVFSCKILQLPNVWFLLFWIKSWRFCKYPIHNSCCVSVKTRAFA